MHGSATGRRDDYDDADFYREQVDKESDSPDCAELHVRALLEPSQGRASITRPVCVR